MTIALRNPIYRPEKINQSQSKATKPGKVFILTDTKQLVPLEKMRTFEIKKSARQLAEDDSQWLGDNDLAERPYDLDAVLTLTDLNVVFSRTVGQIATDVSGGWSLKPKKDDKGSDQEREKIEAFLDHPNDEFTLDSILESLIIDWGFAGYHTLQVVRSADNKIAEIHHIQAHTIWVHKGDKKNGIRTGAREKFAQKVGQGKLWFKRFGLDYNISAKTGARGNFNMDDRADEIIFTKTYYPRNNYYSIPKITPAVGAVIGLIGIRDFNVSFFENYGVPEFMVILSGDWEPGTEQVIAKYLRTDYKGAADAHKTMILSLPEGGSIELKPIAVDEREGSFRIFNQIWTEEVLMAYSMPAYRIGKMPVTSRLGSGSEARELTEIYKGGIVNPLQKSLEDIINLKILRDMEIKTWTWKLDELDTRDVDAEVERLTKLIEHGVITPNRARTELDMGDPDPQGNKFYVSSSLREVGFTKMKARSKG